MSTTSDKAPTMVAVKEALELGLKGQAFVDHVRKVNPEIQDLTVYGYLCNLRRQGVRVPRNIWRSVSKLSSEKRMKAVQNSYEKRRQAGKPCYRSSDRYLPAATLAITYGISSDKIRSLGEEGKIRKRLATMGLERFLYSTNGLVEYIAERDKAVSEGQAAKIKTGSGYSPAEIGALEVGISKGFLFEDLVKLVQAVNPDRPSDSVKSRLRFMRSRNVITRETYQKVMGTVVSLPDAPATDTVPATRASTVTPVLPASVTPSVKLVLGFDDARTLHRLMKSHPEFVTVTAEDILEAIFHE